MSLERKVGSDGAGPWATVRNFDLRSAREVTEAF